MTNDIVYINIEEGSKRVMNNTGLYAKLLTKFKNDTNIQNIDESMAAGDLEKAQVAVHTLKGIAANLSLTELFRQTLELEIQIKGKSVKPEQLTTVKSVYKETLTEIDKVIAQYA